MTITLGGVNQDGTTAVTDMTCIFLKVTEMLALRDPNVNARYYPGVNSTEYLKRLCEVNLITAATPSMHNDPAVIAAMINQGFTAEDARDWSATGCVEPTSSGRHFGHTNCMMLNLVAPLEMALNNGLHPLIGRQIGPPTGDVAGQAGFETFDDFFNAYKRQLSFLIEKLVECNNNFGEAHQYLHPTPFLSSVIQGPMEKGMDLIEGGALYNSSGAALVALTDVVDSMMTIAFNVKVAPGPNDTHGQMLDRLVSYASTYFEMGGMQFQLNVVTTAMLREVMANPDNYRWLLVRISGYNAYFVELNRDTQLELIERTEFNINR